VSDSAKPRKPLSNRSPYTRLEEHLFHQLRNLLELLQEHVQERLQLIADLKRPAADHILLYACSRGQMQTIRVRIYGIQPVRYQIQTSSTALGRRLKRYFALALGEDNLDLQSSVQNGPTLTWVFQVHYPEDVIKRLR
jgi:hypothetical protein